MVVVSVLVLVLSYWRWRCRCYGGRYLRVDVGNGVVGVGVGGAVVDAVAAVVWFRFI